MSESGLTINQTVSLEDALQVVPIYNGSNIPLSQFLEGCSKVKEMYILRYNIYNKYILKISSCLK